MLKASEEKRRHGGHFRAYFHEAEEEDGRSLD